MTACADARRRRLLSSSATLSAEVSVASVAAGDAVRSGADLGSAVEASLSDTDTLLDRIQSFATSAGSSALAAVTGVETSVATHAPSPAPTVTPVPSPAPTSAADRLFVGRFVNDTDGSPRRAARESPPAPSGRGAHRREPASAERGGPVRRRRARDARRGGEGRRLADAAGAVGAVGFEDAAERPARRRAGGGGLAERRALTPRRRREGRRSSRPICPASAAARATATVAASRPTTRRAAQGFDDDGRLPSPINKSLARTPT